MSPKQSRGGFKIPVVPECSAGLGEGRGHVCQDCWWDRGRKLIHPSPLVLIQPEVLGLFRAGSSKRAQTSPETWAAFLYHFSHSCFRGKPCTWNVVCGEDDEGKSLQVSKLSRADRKTRSRCIKWFVRVKTGLVLKPWLCPGCSGLSLFSLKH